MEFGKGAVIRELHAVEALRILEKISNDTVELLGIDPKITRPEWLIVSVLPVAPLSVRPSIAINDSNKSEDELTHKYSSIVKSNNEIRDRLRDKKPREKN